MYTRKAYATREAPRRGQSDDQLEGSEGQARRFGVAEGFVVPMKLGNAGGGKGPQFKTDAIRGERQRNTSRARIKWMFTTEKARAKMGRAYPKLQAKES